MSNTQKNLNSAGNSSSTRHPSTVRKYGTGKKLRKAQARLHARRLNHAKYSYGGDGNEKAHKHLHRAPGSMKK